MDKIEIFNLIGLSFKIKKMKKSILFTLGIFIFFSLSAQQDNDSTLSLIFMGDIMGHDSQIHSAKQTDGSYNYTEVFKYLKPTIEQTDVAIANLEVTLAGEPFKGYPQFSSPDALAKATSDAGIDVLVTANNHSADRRKSGILRTINVLDSMKIKHTGTFRNYQEKEKQSPLIIDKKGFKIAIINYTYGTNGIPVPYPTVVNITKIDSLKQDIQKAKQLKADKVIVFIHWGLEYQRQPNKNQINLAKICFNQGADIVIGSHPHVIQKSEWITNNNNEQFVTYSLGNFVSNQRKRYTDGGQMIKIVLKKEPNRIKIKEAGYMLTWVYTPTIKGKKHFFILPCAQFELKPDFFISKEHFNKMKVFISDSRNLLKTNNKNVNEYLFFNNTWGF